MFAGDRMSGPDTRERARTRALRALAVSGRRLMLLADDAWGVLSGRDRRFRPLVRLDGETVMRMVAAREIVAADEQSWVLAPDYVAETPSPAPRWVFTATAARRVGERMRGFGFIGMARQARAGGGPITLRQARAGLRLIADAERAMADTRLTMNWDAGPSDKNRRGGTSGGRVGSALAAATELRRVRRRMGEPAWRLLWSLCVDGDSLNRAMKRFAITQTQIKAQVEQALDKLAEAYGM